MSRLKHKRWNALAAVNIGMLIGMVIFVLVAAVLYPLIGDAVTDMTCTTGDDYVGADSEAVVSMIPIFYWLAVSLTVIGVALYAIKDQF